MGDVASEQRDRRGKVSGTPKPGVDLGVEGIHHGDVVAGCDEAAGKSAADEPSATSDKNGC
jgi:hypothetical protein